MTRHFSLRTSFGPHWISVQLTFCSLRNEQRKFIIFKSGWHGRKRTHTHTPETASDQIDFGDWVAHSNAISIKCVISINSRNGTRLRFRFDDAENWTLVCDFAWRFLFYFSSFHSHWHWHMQTECAWQCWLRHHFMTLNSFVFEGVRVQANEATSNNRQRTGIQVSAQILLHAVLCRRERLH